tara:strand:- start:6942 stop:8099 length:1158 start_codon:yes stop_codon:yes gene_type:complete
MSDQVQETNLEEDQILDDVVADQEVEVDLDDSIDEGKKASMGDPSEIPDPEAKTNSGKEAPKGGEPMAKLPSTKVGMISAAVEKLQSMKKAEVTNMVTAMMNPKTNEMAVNAMHSPKKKGKKMGEEVEDDSPTLSEIIKVSKDDIDVSEDMKAMFGSEDLSEDFRDKATTIFESAVLSKVNEVLESATIDMNAEIEVERATARADMESKLDDYLDYVVNEWVKENELAIEKGIRSEIVENFMVGLRNLFTENYIDIPEDKVDIVDEMAAKVEEQESAVNEEIEKNIELRKELNALKMNKALGEVSEGLTETQKEKFISLAEGVDYEGDDYTAKLETIKENYFPQEEVVENNDVSDEEPLENLEEETKVNGSMANYMSAISRSIKK